MPAKEKEVEFKDTEINQAAGRWQITEKDNIEQNNNEGKLKIKVNIPLRQGSLVIGLFFFTAH